MQYRRLANTDLTLSVIASGTWAAGGWMWGGTDRALSVAALRKAYELGVTSIDTAPVYGQGLSEEIVAEALQGIPREKVQIMTKFGMRWDLAKGTFVASSADKDGRKIDIYKYAGKKSVMEECENSLRRLKTDYIDLYQIHWPDVTTPMEETWEAVDMLIRQGKVRYAGACNYSADQLFESEKTLNLVSDQIPFSMIKRQAQRETIPYCESHGKSVLVYSPLERGLLTGKMKPGYTFGEGDHRAGNPLFSDAGIERANRFLAEIEPLAEQKGVTLSQLVLAWTVNTEGITVALVGARNPEQAEMNAKAADVALSVEEYDFITYKVHEML